VSTLSSSELKRAKREVRRSVLAVRDAVPATERSRLSVAVTRRFLSLPEVRSARAVFAFWSFGSEVSTAGLIEALDERGVRVTLPRIVDGDLEAVSHRPGDATTEAAFGALEPAGDDVVRPTSIDVVATPGVAFDRQGRRVGYGGGFYDRFLPHTRRDAVRIGLAFGLRVLREGESLPAGHADLSVDAIVTEEETIRCRRVGDAVPYRS
jgi:5-formyltetrahydrofolate cyclo-ligase